LAHGLSWKSFHRGQPCRAYGLWGTSKDRIGLHAVSTARLKLGEDPEWMEFLRNNPDIEEIS
jgi:hypothetical protein